MISRDLQDNFHQAIKNLFCFSDFAVEMLNERKFLNVVDL